MYPTPSQDETHLRVLSILFYVSGGLSFLALCAGGFYAALGAAVLALPPGATGGTRPGEPPPAFLAAVFVGVGAMFALFGTVFGVLKILTGRFLARRTHYIFCLVVSGLICMSVPLGTLLGVFTILVLTRPSVKALFEGEPAAPPPAT